MILDDRRSLTPHLCCIFYLFVYFFSFSVGIGSLACGPLPFVPGTALPCGRNTLLSPQLPNGQKGTHLWFCLACSLCHPPLTFWTLSPCLFKDSKTTCTQTDCHFHSGLLFFLLLSSSLPSLLNRQCMAPVCNNGLQLCLQTNLVWIRHSWFRRRCQRPQLTHNRAIRPAHCSRSHFAPALVPMSEDMSQRIKASWLSLVERLD